MKIKFYSAIIALLLSFSNLFGQDAFIVYTTYDQFVNKEGVEYDEYQGYYHVMGKVTLELKKDGKMCKVASENIWGFYYNGGLFRTDKRTGQFARVISTGKICYYENGIGHITMIHEKTNTAQFEVGYYCYISKTLESDMVPFPKQRILSDANKLLKKFKKENSEYDELFRMIGDNYFYQWVREKIMEFEEME